MDRAEKLRRQSIRDAKRRQEARDVGVCVLCFKNPASRDRCDECRAKRKDGNYFPVAEELSQPASVALRRLHHFDWVTMRDLALACEIGEHDQPAFTAAVSRQVKAGRIERKSVPYWTPRGTAFDRYMRITPAGRAAVERLDQRIAAELQRVAA